MVGEEEEIPGREIKIIDDVILFFVETETAFPTAETVYYFITLQMRLCSATLILLSPDGVWLSLLKVVKSQSEIL